MARPLKKIKGLYEHVPGSGIWYIRYRLDGQLVRKSIGSRDAAIQALDKVAKIRSTGLGTVAKTAKTLTLTSEEQKTVEVGKVTIGDLCDQYERYITDPKNPEPLRDLVNPPQRLKQIRSQFGARAAEVLTAKDIKSWLVFRAKQHGLSNATLNRLRSTFSAVYQFGMEHDLVSSNPIRNFKQFKTELPPPRWLREEEEDRIRAVLRRWVDECPAHHRLQRLELECHQHELTVALGTAMRKGNQYSLRWEWVDLDRRVIDLPDTKTGKAQSIPIIEDVHDAFLKLRKLQIDMEALQRRNEKRKGFERRRMVADGRVFNISENREWWAAALKEARIENYRWHDNRHTTASRMVQAGVPIQVVKEVCGHGSITTTLRYAHLNQDMLATSMAVLNRNSLQVD